jgi:hypothetical protein
MKLFRNIRISLFRAPHTSSNTHVFGSVSPTRGKRRFVGVGAVMLVIAVLGVLATGQVRAGAPDSAQHNAATVARARAAFLKYMSSHRPALRSTALAPLAASGGATLTGSYNWSGFADAEAASTRVSSVSSEWVIPYVQCPGGNYRYSDVIIAQWIGIDGWSNGTVEQLGSATQCFEGVAYYYVWYEMFPNGTVEEGTVDCINNNVDCPRPGDHISASVTATSAGNYTLSLSDWTRPQESFSVTASCAPSTCVDSSAEWIMERPAYDLPFGFQIVPLGDFFQTGFFNGELTSGGKTTSIEGFQDGTVYDVLMVDDTDSYLLDCIGQRGFGPQVLLTTEPSCPAVSPSHGSFNVGWDAAF